MKEDKSISDIFHKDSMDKLLERIFRVIIGIPCMILIPILEFLLLVLIGPIKWILTGKGTIKCIGNLVDKISNYVVNGQYENSWKWEDSIYNL